MELNLTDDDAALLADLLDNAIRDMSPEIADTDNPQFRRELNARRDRLRKILSDLVAASTPPQNQARTT